jgi:hypothetical protein
MRGLNPSPDDTVCFVPRAQAKPQGKGTCRLYRKSPKEYINSYARCRTLPMQNRLLRSFYDDDMSSFLNMAIFLVCIFALFS